MQALVHIRLQARTARKFVTTVQGLEDDLDLQRLLRTWKKCFHCNGAILTGGVIQLNGDQRKNVRDFLVDETICREDCVRLHGF